MFNKRKTLVIVSIVISSIIVLVGIIYKFNTDKKEAVEMLRTEALAEITSLDIKIVANGKNVGANELAAMIDKPLSLQQIEELSLEKYIPQEGENFLDKYLSITNQTEILISNNGGKFMISVDEKTRIVKEIALGSDLNGYLEIPGEKLNKISDNEFIDSVYTGILYERIYPRLGLSLIVEKGPSSVSNIKSINIVSPVYTKEEFIDLHGITESSKLLHLFRVR